MITLDTSAVFTLLNSKDPDHHRTRSAFIADRGPYFVPLGIMAEIAYMLESRSRRQVFDNFLADIQAGAYVLDCGDRDIARIRELTTRYADLPLGFADAAVVTCAERRKRRVLTLDLRHFGVLAREQQLTLLPT